MINCGNYESLLARGQGTATTTNSKLKPAENKPSGWKQIFMKPLRNLYKKLLNNGYYLLYIVGNERKITI